MEGGVGRREVGGLVDVFEEAAVAVRAGDGVGDPDEAAAAVAPVRSGSHWELGNGIFKGEEGEGEEEDEGKGRGLSLNKKKT